MAVGQKKIGIAVVVIIEKLQTPAAQQASCRTDLARLVSEGKILLVMVEAEQLLIDIGNKQILPAVAVKVRGIYTHTRARRAVVSEGYACLQPNFLKGPVALVDKKEIRHRVVGHKQISPAVVIHVSCHHTKRLAGRFRDARFFADIRKRAVAVIVVEMAGSRFEDAWNAIEFLAQTIVAASRFLVVVNEAGNEQIELAVFIIVEPDGAGGPSRRRDSGFLGYVCERAVAVVVIEGVPGRIAGCEKIRRATVNEIDIHPAIIVVIEEHAAGANRLRQIAVCGQGVVVHPIDSRLLCHVGKDHWWRGSGLLRIKARSLGQEKDRDERE